MVRIRTRRISPWERRQLHRMKRQLRNTVNNSHARIILLSSGGVGNRQIAQHVGRTPQWVRIVLHRFNEGGIAAIEWYPWLQPRGQPRRFTAEVLEEIAAVALSPPQQLIGMTQWSLPKLRIYLVEQRIVGEISLEWLRVLLRRRGVRWRRTKTWKESTDPEFWPKYRRIRRLYRRRPAGGRRLCLDEFGPLNLQPRHGLCWTGPGRRVDRLPATYSRRAGVRHFLAAYDLESGKLYGMFSRTKRWQDFLRFLQIVRSLYPPREVLHIVLDNYRPHQRAEVTWWAKVHKIHFYFTPTNASWLNRIESEFTALKKFALTNSHYSTHADQRDAICRYLAWKNGGRPLSLQRWRRRHTSSHSKAA